MCEDYRAGLTVDRAADDADRAGGRRVACPTLVAWSVRDDIEDLYGDPPAVVAGVDPCATHVVGPAVAPHMAEEAPEQLAEVLSGFLAAAG
jgi:haloacetate dehalogenase